MVSHMKFRGAHLLRKKLPKVPVSQRIKDWTICPGDTVKIIAGRKDVGEQGKVLQVDKENNTVLVEGRNLVFKHIKPNAEQLKGAKLQKPAPISVHNVMFVDPGLGEATKVKLVKVFDKDRKAMITQRLTDEGSLHPIPGPEDHFKERKEGKLDTPADLVQAVTWWPSITESPFPAMFLNQLEKMRRRNKESHAF